MRGVFIAFLLVFFAYPVWADDARERLKLATEFHDIRPLRDNINAGIENLAQGFGGQARENFITNMKLRINYDDLESQSIKIMADVFTVEELNAMIAYYGSAVGKAAEAKATTYQTQFTPVVRKALDAALAAEKFGEKPQ
jgi:hypothetical protein